MKIYDPHEGAWAQRTTGWPRSLNTSTAPTLPSNDVGSVGAGLSLQPAFDPRTGGPHPSFVIGFNAGTDTAGVVKDNGSFFSTNAQAPDGTNSLAAIVNGKMLFTGTDDRLETSDDIHTITADDFTNSHIVGVASDVYPWGLGDGGSNPPAPTAAAVAGNKVAYASAVGLGVLTGVLASVDQPTSGTADIMQFVANRTFNSGYALGDIRGIWLANSKTVDRSYRTNTLTEAGTVTEAAVESGAELLGYSGWSTSNYLSRADDADYNGLGSGSAHMSVWVKSSGTAATEDLIAIGNSGGDVRLIIEMMTNGTIRIIDDGATAQVLLSTGQALDDNSWHKIDLVRHSSTSRSIFVDGVWAVSDLSTDAGSLSGTILLAVGIRQDYTNNPATSSTLALARLSVTAPTATQVRQMYDAEKGMFVASAECLLQSGSTDAVLDVDVDPLTGKVLVTQTDAITIFDGLVVDSKPAVNAGASEKGKLWGDLRAEQNSVNAYVTAPAVDQRQVNEMVRGLASDLPAGVDLGKAKAWAIGNKTGGTLTIYSSYNIKAMTDNGSGEIINITMAVPFKSYFNVVTTAGTGRIMGVTDIAGNDNVVPSGNLIERLYTINHAGTLTETTWAFACFGELENE